MSQNSSDWRGYLRKVRRNEGRHTPNASAVVQSD